VRKMSIGANYVGKLTPMRSNISRFSRGTVAGNMVLAITLGKDGRVKKIHAAKSLSPRLDKAAIDTVRRWRFKKIEGNADVSLENLQLKFIFRATCHPRF